VLLAAVLCAAPARGQFGFQEARDLAEPRVQWDFNLFGPAPEGPFRLEVYYKIFNDGLTYRKFDGTYVAAYRLEILVYQDDEQVEGTTFEEEYKVESFPRTLSQTDFLINQINLTLAEAGDYELLLRLRDLKSNQATETRLPVKIPKKPPTWYLSGLEFARHVERASDSSQFNKRGLLVVPSVSRSYGGEAQLTCPFYAEIYGPADTGGTPIRLAFTGWDDMDKQVIDTTFDFVSVGRVTPVVAGLAVSNLAPGNYRIEVDLQTGPNWKSQYLARDEFRIMWSLSTLLRTDYRMAVEQLKYIMTSGEERDSLLHAPDSLRAERWERFWSRRDPTPGTPMNEFRDEYYRRIRYANASFSVGTTPGWRTDRGMIYISYGEPDEVERHPFDMDGQLYTGPWQVWYYYNPARRFVFVDSRVTDDYRLQYPYDGDPWKHY
jgi:GWxTD domain-containing protein